MLQEVGEVRGETDLAEYVGREISTSTPMDAIEDTLDGFPENDNVTTVTDWAKQYISWDVLHKDDVFCLNKDARMVARSVMDVQQIRKISGTAINVVSFRNGTLKYTVEKGATFYPGPSRNDWTTTTIETGTYASLEVDWTKLKVEKRDETNIVDNKGDDNKKWSYAVAYILAHRNESEYTAIYTPNSEYSNAQNAVWMIVNNCGLSDTVLDNNTNYDSESKSDSINKVTEKREALDKELNNRLNGLYLQKDDLNKSINNIGNIESIKQTVEDLKNYFEYPVRSDYYENGVFNQARYEAALWIYNGMQEKLSLGDPDARNKETEYENAKGKLNKYNELKTQLDSLQSIIDEKQAQLDQYDKQIAEFAAIKNAIDEANDAIPNQIYKSAVAFAEYILQLKEPILKSSNDNYEFKYVRKDDAFLTGPISVEYTMLKTQGVKELVGEITSTILTAKMENGGIKTLENGTDYDIVDENGKIINLSSETENENVINGTLDFYIKVKNQSIKKYNIKYIVDFTMNFKYKDLVARGYKISDPKGEFFKHYKWTRKEETNASDACYIYCPEREEYEDVYGCTNDPSKYCWTCYRYHTVYHYPSGVHYQKYRLEREAFDPRTGYAELQPTFVCAHTHWFWRYYELKITFKPDKGLPTYIDLGGKVWVDNPIDNGKVIESSNGLYDDGEYGRENVLVELCFWGENDAIKVNDSRVIPDSRNENLVDNSYKKYTDKDGNYMFYGLPVEQKYFVRFTYDGQTYEKTLYLAGGDEEEYKNNPNDSKYYNNSKVKDETDRQGFNNRFKEITYANIGTRGTGKASGASTPLSYIFKTYKENEASYIKSKIITTDNRTDAEYGEPTRTDIKKQTGKTVDPFKIQARTAESLKYPFEKNGEILIWSTNDSEPLRYLTHINLGLKIRSKADFQLSTQIKAGATTIKDKEKVVIYPQSAKKDDLMIDFTRQEDEYIKQEISAADYNWADQFVKIYGENGRDVTGYVVDEEKLHVYVLYRIAIKNQCDDINDYGIINEIIDYYDNRLERVPNSEIARASKLFRDAFKDEDGNPTLSAPLGNVDSWIEREDKSSTKETRVDWTDSSTVGNYQMMKSTTSITVKESNSETAIYLILKVKDNGTVLETGTNRSDKDGMQNIAEIGSYTVMNKNDGVVGKIDKDSAPGNATPGNRETYEDDTDASPMFRLEINWTPKEIKGTVWDDDIPNTEGIKNTGEFGIKNVTVKLVEHIVQADGTVKEVERPGIELKNNRIYVDPQQSVKTDNNGSYSFYVEGGNYSLKFIYGDQEMLLTNKKYNAQDYQATKPYNALSSGRVAGYNQSDKLKAFATNEELVRGLKNFLVVGQEDTTSNLDWNISAIFGPENDKRTQPQEESKDVSSTVNNLSSARDLAQIRADIIENTQELIYNNASRLDELNGNGGVSSGDTARFLSGGNTAAPRQVYKDNGNYTYMEAVSDIIVIASNDLITEPNVINLGLKERPTASRKLEKQVDRIILTASDGTILVDTDDNTKQKGLQKLDNIQQTFINLEPGLMDGALLDIYYTLIVTNDSTDNDDCLQNYWYVNNTRNNDTKTLEDLRDKLYPSYSLTTPLPIRAEIFDYVNINLEYRADDNKYKTQYEEDKEIWTRVYEESGNTGNTIGKEDFLNKNGTYYNWLSDKVREVIPRDQKQVSKILQTNTNNYDGDGLLKGESVQIPIHLGITLSEDTSGKNLNDFDFSNCAELTQITTTAGRRDYDTIPGNYVPYDKPKADDDAFLTGTTAITPPLGEGRFYYVIAIVSASIVLVGIVLIKKKVLKK